MATRVHKIPARSKPIRACFAVGSGNDNYSALSSGDKITYDVMVSLGWSIKILNHVTCTKVIAEGYDLVFCSESVNSGTIGVKLTNHRNVVIQNENAILDQMEWYTDDTSDSDTSRNYLDPISLRGAIGEINNGGFNNSVNITISAGTLTQLGKPDSKFITGYLKTFDFDNVTGRTMGAVIRPGLVLQNNSCQLNYGAWWGTYSVGLDSNGKRFLRGYLEHYGNLAQGKGSHSDKRPKRARTYFVPTATGMPVSLVGSHMLASLVNDGLVS